MWWDAALSESEKADYSASSTWVIANRRLHLVDVQRGRWESPTLVRVIRSHYEAIRSRFPNLPVRVYMQHTPIDLGVAQHLRAETQVPVILEPLRRGEHKLARERMAAVQFEAERMLIPHSLPHLEEWIHEHKAYQGRKEDADDWVDCTSGIALKVFGRPILRDVPVRFTY